MAITSRNWRDDTPAALIARDLPRDTSNTFRPHLRQPYGANVPGSDEIGHRADRFLDGNVRIETAGR